MKEGTITIILFCSIFVNIIFVALISYKYYLRNVESNQNKYTTGNSFWQDKVTYYEALNKETKGNVFLVGDSMFERLPIEPFLGSDIESRGIGYDNINSLFVRLERSILSGKPRKIILFIGGNDISKHDDVERIIIDTEKLLKIINDNGIELFFISLLPKGEHYYSSHREVLAINNDILYFNKVIESRCNDAGIKFVDITKYFTTDTFYLDKKFTSDEIHLNTQGVLLLADLLEQYVQ